MVLFEGSIWFYMYMQVVLSLDSTKVTGVSGSTISDLYYPCQQNSILSMCCHFFCIHCSLCYIYFLESTSFLDYLYFGQCTILFSPLEGQSLLQLKCMVTISFWRALQSNSQNCERLNYVWNVYCSFK